MADEDQYKPDPMWIVVRTERDVNFRYFYDGSDVSQCLCCGQDFDDYGEMPGTGILPLPIEQQVVSEVIRLNAIGRILPSGGPVYEDVYAEPHEEEGILRSDLTNRTGLCPGCRRAPIRSMLYMIYRKAHSTTDLTLTDTIKVAIDICTEKGY